MNTQSTPLPPLQGLRVVELGNYIAGPGTAMTLGDLGAEVVKIESLEGDAARHTGHFGHAMLRAYNRGKKSIALTVRLQPTTATLTEAEIEAVSAKIIEKVSKATGGTLRG